MSEYTDLENELLEKLEKLQKKYDELVFEISVLNETIHILETGETYV